jgi:hypothetical protein
VRRVLQVFLVLLVTRVNKGKRVKMARKDLKAEEDLQVLRDLVGQKGKEEKLVHQVRQVETAYQDWEVCLELQDPLDHLEKMVIKETWDLLVKKDLKGVKETL